MNFVTIFVMLMTFLFISWILRYVVSKDVTRRVDRKLTEESVGFCTWPKEV